MLAISGGERVASLENPFFALQKVSTRAARGDGTAGRERVGTRTVASIKRTTAQSPGHTEVSFLRYTSRDI